MLRARGPQVGWETGGVQRARAGSLWLLCGQPLLTVPGKLGGDEGLKEEELGISN